MNQFTFWCIHEPKSLQVEPKEEVKPKAPPDGGATGGVVIVAALLPLKFTAVAGGGWLIEWDYTKVRRETAIRHSIADRDQAHNRL